MSAPVTALLHADLIVHDLERALGFYVGQLGCAVADDVVLEGAVPAFYSGGQSGRMRLVMLQVAQGPWGAMLELMAFDPPRRSATAPPCAPELPAAGRAHVSLLVEDLEDTCARLGAAGVAAVSEIMTVALPRLGTSRIVFVRDPDGHLVELVATVGRQVA